MRIDNIAEPRRPIGTPSSLTVLPAPLFRDSYHPAPLPCQVMNTKHVFSARVRLLSREDGGLPGWFISVDETTGKAIASGFPIGHDPDWYESRWEFDEPMVIPGTTFTGRFRLLQAERFDDLFNVGMSFDLFGLGARGVGAIGTGIIRGKRTMAPDEPLTWPSKAPSFHRVKPDLSLPARLRASPAATKEALALASKMEIVSTLPSAPDPWLLSDCEFALLSRITETHPEKSE